MRCTDRHEARHALRVTPMRCTDTQHETRHSLRDALTSMKPTPCDALSMKPGIAKPGTDHSLLRVTPMRCTDLRGMTRMKPSTH